MPTCLVKSMMHAPLLFFWVLCILILPYCYAFPEEQSATNGNRYTLALSKPGSHIHQESIEVLSSINIVTELKSSPDIVQTQPINTVLPAGEILSASVNHLIDPPVLDIDDLAHLKLGDMVVKMPNDTDISESNYSHLAARAFSIDVHHPGDPLPPFGPWPRDQCNLAWVDFCFLEAIHLRILRDVFFEAVSRWAAGLHPYSALSIRPEQRCGQNWECVCDPNLSSQKTLHIQLTPAGTSDWATFAYWNPHGHETHFLSIAGGRTRDMTLNHMVHELGHVFGFAHEHQRPDRDNHIEFRPLKLKGAREAAASLATANDPLFHNIPDANDRLKAVCSSFTLSLKYFQVCADFLPTHNFINVHGYPATPLIQASPYDIDSIMHYASYSGSSSNNLPAADEAPLVRKDHPNNLIIGVDRGVPSPLDIARLRQLYPLINSNNPGAGQGSSHGKARSPSEEDMAAGKHLNDGGEDYTVKRADEGLQPAKWGPLKVVIPHYFTTTVYPHNKTSATMVDTWIELPNETTI